MSKLCFRKEVSNGISDIKLFIKEGFKIIISGIVLLFPVIIVELIMYIIVLPTNIKFIFTIGMVVVTMLWNFVLGLPIITCYIYPKRDPYA
jgi:hypothetical protein